MRYFCGVFHSAECNIISTRGVFSRLYMVFMCLFDVAYIGYECLCVFIEFSTPPIELFFARDFRKRAVCCLRVTKMFLLGRRKNMLYVYFFQRDSVKSHICGCEGGKIEFLHYRREKSCY